jgi:hypothetical protein
MLENQCSMWPDPIAAVVYVPTLHGLIYSTDDASLNGSYVDDAVEQLNAFYQRMQQQGAATSMSAAPPCDFKRTLYS